VIKVLIQYKIFGLDIPNAYKNDKEKLLCIIFYWNIL